MSELGDAKMGGGGAGRGAAGNTGKGGAFHERRGSNTRWRPGRGSADTTEEPDRDVVGGKGRIPGERWRHGPFVGRLGLMFGPRPRSAPQWWTCGLRGRRWLRRFAGFEGGSWGGAAEQARSSAHFGGSSRGLGRGVYGRTAGQGCARVFFGGAPSGSADGPDGGAAAGPCLARGSGGALSGQGGGACGGSVERSGA